MAFARAAKVVLSVIVATWSIGLSSKYGFPRGLLELFERYLNRTFNAVIFLLIVEVDRPKLLLSSSLAFVVSFLHFLLRDVSNEICTSLGHRQLNVLSR